MDWRIILTILVLLSEVGGGANPTTQPTAESRLITELYGKRITQVRTSRDPADDVALAREMLLAAADSVNPTLLRHLLAMEAVKLAAEVGNAEATQLANEALSLADKLKPLAPMEKCRLAVQIAERRYTFARRSGDSVKARTPLASALVKAELALIGALMRERNIRQADSVLTDVRAMARAHKLRKQQVDIEAVTEALKAMKDRLVRIRRFEARLRRAKETNDLAAEKTACRSLGLIYLLEEGDIPKADSYLSGTENQYESSAAIAAAFLKNPRKIPPVAACNKAIEQLSMAAKSAKNKQARVRIATAGMNLCRGLLAGKPAGLEAVKSRLLLGELERLAGDSPADRFIRRLKKNYGGLDGKIEVIKDNLVRFSYDFTNRKQLDDWQVGKGKWEVLRTKGILTCTPHSRQHGDLVSRLRFRADKPLLFTFRARGKQNLTGTMFLQPENDPTKRHNTRRLRFEFGAYRNSRSFLIVSGRLVWASPKVKITPNSINRIEIAWDGQCGLTWTVNGKIACKHNLQYRKTDLPYTSLFIGLWTYRQPAAFDDVKIEGVILEKPYQRLTCPEPKPKHHKPKRPPPKRYKPKRH